MSVEESSILYGDCLPDAEIAPVIHWFISQLSDQRATYPPKTKSYKLTFGVLLRSLSGLKRVVGRTLIPPPLIHDDTCDMNVDSNINRFHALVRYFTRAEDYHILDQSYPPIILYSTAIELKFKQETLSPKLIAEFHCHPLYARDIITNRLIFHNSFLIKVLEFHERVKRPPGTYEIEILDENIAQLAYLRRDLCPECNSSRQIYCGDCGGVRLPIAEALLPPRIDLPFDILLLVHWQESMHKCTGMHAMALSNIGQVSYVTWPRLIGGGDISSIMESLDPSRDVLLFPSKDAILAQDFQWHQHVGDKVVDRNDILRKRYRLVVLEASWNHGKTMANQIMEYRAAHNLDPISCVILSDIVGQYWRFQREGHAAVSTIEAIAYTAVAAGLNTSYMNDLLCLFQAQKYRVLNRVADGGIAPQAIAVQGSGVGSWKEYTDLVILS